MFFRIGFCNLTVISILSTVVLFSGGCGQQMDQMTENQAKAISVYVDALMLNELNERDKAIQKLNLALELDPEFALAYSLRGDIFQEMAEYEKSISG